MTKLQKEQVKRKDFNLGFIPLVALFIYLSNFVFKAVLGRDYYFDVFNMFFCFFLFLLTMFFSRWDVRIK